ncbi:hypothetical protein SBF1_2820004 [Candidatus Desulfosporosinus infrequens]|uniref:Uncharacterized protein n=1 Tax=Candidatus Desulfosporosinus infrequens TaxID=2043169 RepID=A0A2U3KUI1_9FIRM|nr:hypothetical protein SBF1_2820004 [Candidatus Desulfosporosinus infrequens]
MVGERKAARNCNNNVTEATLKEDIYLSPHAPVQGTNHHENCYFLTNKKRGGSFSVYEIKEKGIELLFNLGKIEQKRRAKDLSLPRVEMLDRVEISKLAINLTQSGWSFLGSSDGKKEEELPNTSLMQCLLTSPEKRRGHV